MLPPVIENDLEGYPVILNSQMESLRSKDVAWPKFYVYPRGFIAEADSAHNVSRIYRLPWHLEW